MLTEGDIEVTQIPEYFWTAKISINRGNAVCAEVDIGEHIFLYPTEELKAQGCG